MIDLSLSLEVARKASPEDLLKFVHKEPIRNVENTKYRSKKQKELAKATVKDFVASKGGSAIMVFTDGSVKNRSKDNLPSTMDYGARSSILIPLGNSLDVHDLNMLAL